MGLLSDKIATLKLSSPLTVPSGTSVRQVIEQRRQHQAGCVLVCQEQRVVGIMTERDVLMKVVARDVNQEEPVDKFMTPEPVTLTRDRTIGEAITLMNDEAFMRAARGLARRMMESDGRNVSERVVHGFRRCVVRRPNGEERAVLASYYEKALQEFESDLESAKKLIKQDKPFIEKFTVAESAAWTMVANVMLNLDETITRE